MCPRTSLRFFSLITRRPPPSPLFPYTTLFRSVYDPLRGELFSAARGSGARLGNARLAVSDKRDLASALIATGFGYVAAQRVTQGRIIAQMLGEVRDVRRFGSAALDLSWLAAGR